MTVSTMVVAVDVGKTSVALSVSDTTRSRLFGPVDFPMTRSGLADVVARVQRVLPGERRVKVGVEAPQGTTTGH